MHLELCPQSAHLNNTLLDLVCDGDWALDESQVATMNPSLWDQVQVEDVSKYQVVSWWVMYQIRL
jgi:hypothetical protein